MNNSGYADRDQERHQHGGTWDGWQYGGNKSDASRQSFGPSDSYRDPVKSSSIPHQHDTHDAGFHKSDYDDGNRAKVAPKMGYGRKDARFTHQGVSSNRFPQRGLSQGVSIPSDEPTQRGVANARYGYKGYDSSFQRPPHRRSDHSGSAKDDYPHYPHQDVRDEPRHDPRRPHRPAHPMDHQDDNDNEQGMKRGKQPDIPGFLPRGRLPKRPRSHGSPQSPSRSSDARQEIMIRGRIPGADADLTEPKTQGDVFHQGASDYTDFYSLERAIMLEPLASVCSSFFEAIDRGVEPSLECCRKLLMASSSRGEVVIMRKVLSYMQYAFRDLMRSDDYIIATQGYALLGDSQNIKNVRDYAAKQGIILSPASWVQLLRYVCSVDKNTPDITRIVVEETLKGSATSALSSALDFLLHQCLENSLTEECMQIIHKFRKISTDGEYVFDSRTLTDLVEHLMSLSDFRSACQIIQLSYSLKQNVSIKTVLSFVSECASRQRYSNLAKQAYLLLRRYDRFSYRDAEQLQNVIEGLAKARLIPESIVVLQDVVSSMFPINSPHALIALLTSITDEADCKEAISTFKQLLSQRSLVPRQNSKLYEELTRFFFENGTPENIMWLRDYSRDLCIAMTSAMRRFLLNSEGAFITNSDIVGVKSPNHGPQDTYQNMPFNTARSSE